MSARRKLRGVGVVAVFLIFWWFFVFGLFTQAGMYEVQAVGLSVALSGVCSIGLFAVFGREGKSKEEKEEEKDKSEVKASSQSQYIQPTTQPSTAPTPQSIPEGFRDMGEAVVVIRQRVRGKASILLKDFKPEDTVIESVEVDKEA